MGRKTTSKFSAQAVKQQIQNQELAQGAAFGLSAFDNDSSTRSASSCQYFAVAAQGVDAFRLRIWDTRTSQLTVEHAAPAGLTCTVLAWGVVTTGDAAHANEDAGEKKKKRRRSGALAAAAVASAGPGGAQKVLAIGLSNGEVQLFSLAQAKVIRTLAGVHSAGVTDFTFANDGVRGFSGGLDGLAVEWDVRSGAELGRFADGKPVKKVALSHDGSRLLTAGHAIKLWDLSTRQLLKTLPGHASEVIRLQFSADDKTCVSAADEDRHIGVWDATAEGHSDHVVSLTMDMAPTSVALSGTNHVLALAEEGEVFFWSTLEKQDNQPTPSKKKKKVATAALSKAAQGHLKIVSSESDDEAKRIAILAATFSDGKVLIARGSVVKPIFERVDYLTEEGKLAPVIELSRKPMHSLLIDQAAVRSASSAKTLVTPYREEDILILGASDLPVDTAALDIDASGASSEQSAAALREPTLEERLAAISVAPTDETTGARKSKSKRPPTATSLHHLVSQGIHTGDVQLLEQAFHVHDPDAILATVRRLPPSQVIPLLDQLTMRLQNKPIRARELVEWVRAIVLVHAGYLLSAPHLAGGLSALYQTLDSRVGVFQKLLRLSGRLDLVVSQNALRNRVAAGNEGGRQQLEALYTYDEDEDDDEHEYEARGSDGADAVDGMDEDEEDYDEDDSGMSEDEDEDDDEDEDEDDEDDQDANASAGDDDDDEDDE
ncbi:WD repeat-containing protein 43 [Geranomyces michiganensis]|nr:WD repeat-containing protein 43 [Geranomyces michiganensis]